MRRSVPSLTSAAELTASPMIAVSYLRSFELVDEIRMVPVLLMVREPGSSIVIPLPLMLAKLVWRWVTSIRPALLMTAVRDWAGSKVM